MIRFGFTRLLAEWSIYYKNCPSGRSIIVVHVDDMNVAASNPVEIAHIKQELRTEFDIIKLGPVRWLIGLSIWHDHDTRTMGISQTALIDSIITQFSLADVHHASTPLDHNVCLSHDDCPQTESDHSAMATILYHQLIRSLMYLVLSSRPDIAFAVSHLS
ncbi:hypothetical protein EW146_g9810 [Bondarzewia mesenterica]|uniref:Reverse transcriptase Ty1/copia-type domain-containing protein n=1 Tax=Bondarzewia mesenterica TaxID=1095465 RepID=A0A4S4L397_9AGAM|nr:hypothetical protein EW146_g9810 [Bondarzewia mesenterica]